jgi:hypothetical protein
VRPSSWSTSIRTSSSDRPAHVGVILWRPNLRIPGRSRSSSVGTRQQERVDVVGNNAGNLRDKLLWKVHDADPKAVIAFYRGGQLRFARACALPLRPHKARRIAATVAYPASDEVACIRGILVPVDVGSPIKR